MSSKDCCGQLANNDHQRAEPPSLADLPIFFLRSETVFTGTCKNVFVPEINSRKRIKKVLRSNEINAELNKLKNDTIDRSIEQSVNSL